MDDDISSLEKLVDSYLPGSSEAHLGGSRCRMTLTWAQSLDARISAGRGLRTKLSGSHSHKMTHYLRTKHDAILVGWKTVEADNPKLNCRYPGFEGKIRPVILDSRLQWQAHVGEWAVLENAKAGTGLAPFVLTTVEPEGTPAADAVKAVGGEIFKLGSMEWSEILDRLGAASISTVMVEGGARVIRSALHSALTHCIIVTVAPAFLGEGGVEVVPRGRLDLQAVSWWQQTGCADSVVCGRQETSTRV